MDIVGGLALMEEENSPELYAGDYLTDEQTAEMLGVRTLADQVEAIARVGHRDQAVAIVRASAGWHLVPCLDALRDEVNAAWPNRDRGSDGTIGNLSHQSGASDHNPDTLGRVLALDLDADGVPMAGIVLACVGEWRLQYIIYQGVIWSRSWGWKARKYTGPNKHRKHAHFSARHDHRGQENRERWLPDSLTRPGKPRPPKKPPARSLPHDPGTRVLSLARPYLIGADVRYVQRFIGPRWCGRADGVYGPKTTIGVRKYQSMRGIRVDGIVGPITWRNMGVRWRG